MTRANLNMSRRTLLMSGGAAIGVAAVGGYMLFPVQLMAASDLSHKKPMAIPAQDMGNMVDGVRVFDLGLQKGVSKFFDGLDTDTMGINGAYLGPVLRMRKGEETRLNVTNNLGEPSTLHWHGFNLPARMDGGPHQQIEAGEVWSPQFPITDKAATMWFHSHLFHGTADQVWAGVAGMAIIDDVESDGLELPREYGVDDIPVVLQDRGFRKNGQMPYSPGMQSRMMGMIGNFPVVNGVIAPYLDVTTSLVRLRILNGSNGSIYQLEFNDGRTFNQIASDGGLLNAPAKMNRLQLAPGERAEIVVDVSDGKPFRLVNNPSAAPRSGGMMGGGGGAPAFSFLEIRPANNLAASAPLPTTLANLPMPDESAVKRTRKFELQMGMMGSGFRINGQDMKMDVINEVVKKGETEIWEVSSNGMLPHPFHVHNTQYRVLSRNGRAPAPNEAGLKDTVVVNPGEVVRILVRFDTYTDAERPYMYHCHILEHEDGGMMGQFTVV
jgi:FtsP/CotA-like multicopper oxidase with cupredoxin domain